MSTLAGGMRSLPCEIRPSKPAPSQRGQMPRSPRPRECLWHRIVRSPVCREPLGVTAPLQRPPEASGDLAQVAEHRRTVLQERVEIPVRLGRAVGRAQGGLEVGFAGLIGSGRVGVLLFEAAFPGLAAAIAGSNDPKPDTLVRCEDLPVASGRGGTWERNSLRSVGV